MFFTLYEAVKGKIKGQNRSSWISTVFCRQLKLYLLYLDKRVYGVQASIRPFVFCKSIVYIDIYRRLIFYTVRKESKRYLEQRARFLTETDYKRNFPNT